MFEGKLSNHHGDFYCLNCLNSYTTENKLKEHEEIYNNHDSCCIQMPNWIEEILKYNPEEKSLKAPFEKNTNLVKTIPKSLTQKKKFRHEPSGWTMLTKCSFDKKENKCYYYRGKDCIDKMCKKLKKHVLKIINY